jgi:4-aminobutyrate aminotransferase
MDKPLWRRGWDSNPRSLAGHTISNRADSAALAPLLARQGILEAWCPGATAGSCATPSREPGQGRKAAALSGSWRVPQSSLAAAPGHHRAVRSTGRCPSRVASEWPWWWAIGPGRPGPRVAGCVQGGEAVASEGDSIHAALRARHERVLPRWLGLYYDEPIALVEGSGRHVIDAEGRRYLDFFGGILTTMAGYNVPEIVEAVQEQAGRMVHSSTLYLIESQIELAERIAALSGIPEAKVFFTNSGTEANEAALLVASNWRRSNQLVAVRGSYHGRSFGAMAVTGQRGWSASGLTPFAVTWVPSGYRYRSPYGDLDDDEFVARCRLDAELLLEATTAGDVAGFIAEPIQGVAGFVVPPRGYLRAMVTLMAEHHIPFISDEVQTGWGRTGEATFGALAEGVTPDAMTFAKGLGNGLAIGGVVGRPELIDAVAVSSISTFGGNPLATRAALATLDYVAAHRLQDNARVMGARLLEGLTRLDAPGVGEVRGRGLMVGVEMVRPGGREPDPEAARSVLEETRARGLLVGRGGLYGHVLRLAPALSVTAAEVDEAVDVLAAAFEAVERHRETAGAERARGSGALGAAGPGR